MLAVRGENQRGFTLIELVIVLAIAALVLAAILLAVGGAQRSQRDTTTKNAAGRVGQALQNYASNHGGQMLVYNTNLPANYLTGILDGLGGAPKKGTKATGVAGKEIRYEGSGVCATPGQTGGGIIAGGPTNYAVDYWVENGHTDVCIDNQ